MAIPSNTKTPGAYTSINTQTQRTGLPAQDHKVLLLVSDDSAGVGSGDGGLETVSTQAQADTLSGDKNSNLSRMTRAALATTLALSMQVANASVSGGGSGIPATCDADTYALENPEVTLGDVGYLTLSIDGEPDRVLSVDTDISGNTFAFTLFRNLLTDDSNLFSGTSGGGTAAFFLDSASFGNYSLFGNSDDGLTPEPHNVVFKPTAGLVAGEVDLAQLVFGLQLGSSLTVHSCALNTIAAS